MPVNKVIPHTKIPHLAGCSACYLNKFVDHRNLPQGTFIDDAARATGLWINGTQITGNNEQKKQEVIRFSRDFLDPSQQNWIKTIDLFTGLADDFDMNLFQFVEVSLDIILLCIPKERHHLIIKISHAACIIDRSSSWLGSWVYANVPGIAPHVKYTTQLEVYGQGLVDISVHNVEYDRVLAPYISLAKI